MLFPPDIVKSIRSTVCAIGYLKSTEAECLADPGGSHVRLFGTGFLASRAAVVTARHVLLKLFAELDKKGLPKDRARLVFETVSGNKAIFQNIPFGRAVWLENETQDLGFVTFTAPSAEWSRSSTPAAFEVDSAVRVGQEVGLFGYPQGNLGIERDDDAGRRRTYRVGPVLQHGYVSAIAPTDEADNVDRYLLDVRTNVGMSGGPVFDPYTGAVVGLHDRGLAYETAFAIPLSRGRIEYLLERSMELASGSALQIALPTVKRRREA